jgi:predicted dithiol-disulfide oxidoreductase (DUF899 family)
MRATRLAAEPVDHARRREELRLAEIELIRQRERVAELRRALPASAHPAMSADIPERGIDLLNPVWHVLDLTPQGRGDWYAELDYGATDRNRD